MDCAGARAGASTRPAAALQTLGRCLDKLGDFASGEKALKKSLDLRAKYNPPGSWLVASSEGVLGEHYALVKQFPRAEAMLFHSHSVFVSTFGPAHARTVMSIKRLITLYESWGHPAKAATYRALAEAAKRSN